eukprot:6196800-Pleurochrysis_carterae.AAC.1
MNTQAVAARVGRQNERGGARACGSCLAEQWASRSVLMVIVSGWRPWRAICSSSLMERLGWQQPHTSHSHVPRDALHRQRDTALIRVLYTTCDEKEKRESHNVYAALARASQPPRQRRQSTNKPALTNTGLAN